MKKRVLYFLCFFIFIFILLEGFNLLSIKYLNSPLLFLSKNNISGGTLYSGLFYNTYLCDDEFYIKSKTSKFTCSVEGVTEFTIVDESKYVEDFACDESLEEIYRNEDYSYNLACVMSSYIYVVYSDGSKKNIKSAVNNNKIDIDDLKDYGISYVKIPIKD